MKRLFLLLVVATLAAGCSSTPKQSFNGTANSHIRQVAVLTPSPVNEVQVSMLAHPTGSAFGMAGALIAAADQATKTRRYNKVVGESAPDWTAYTQQQLIDALQQAGYQTQSVSLPRKTSKHLSKYPGITADAVLDYYFTVGQIAAGATSNYVPTAIVMARLVDLKSKKILYEEQVSSGLPVHRNAVILPPGGKEYANMTDLTANATESVESLKRGIQQVAQRIASDLKK